MCDVYKRRLEGTNVAGLEGRCVYVRRLEGTYVAGLEGQRDERKRRLEGTYVAGLEGQREERNERNDRRLEGSGDERTNERPMPRGLGCRTPNGRVRYDGKRWK